MSIDQQSSMEGSTEESWPEIEHIRESSISTINEPATFHVPDIMNEECLDLPDTFTSSLQNDGLQFDILDPLPPPLTLPEGEMLVTPSIQQVDNSDSTTDMSPSIPVVVKTSDISTNNDQIKPTAGTDVNQEILELIPQLGIRTPNDDTRPLSQIRYN